MKSIFINNFKLCVLTFVCFNFPTLISAQEDAERILENLKEDYVIGEYSQYKLVTNHIKDGILFQDKESKKWGFVYLNDIRINPYFDEIIFPYYQHKDSVDIDSPITKFEGKWGVTNELYNYLSGDLETIKEGVFFNYDEIIPEIHKDSTVTTYYKDFLKARRGKYWGLISKFNGVPVTAFQYKNEKKLNKALANGLKLPSVDYSSFGSSIFKILRSSAYTTALPVCSDNNLFLIEKNSLWGLAYQVYDDLITEIQPEYTSIDFNLKNQYNLPQHLILTKDNTYGFIKTNGYEETPLNQINEGVQFGFEDVELIKKNNTEYAVTKKDGKWGFIEPYSGIILSDYIYDNPEDVPLYLLDEYEITEMQKILKSLPVSKVEFDKNNGDGVFRAKLKETGKWGMYQGYNGNYNNLIPAKYDEINFFSWNGNFSIVKNNEKYGVVLSPWSNEDLTNLETIPCQYEDYKIIEYESEKYPGYTDKFIAFKQKEKWAFVNYKNGKSYSKFVYNSPENLPYPLSK